MYNNYIMEKTNFIANLYKFLHNLNRYSPNDTTTKLLKEYQNLDIEKIILRINSFLGEYRNDINEMNDEIFGKEFMILPGLDLSVMWKEFKDAQKSKVWTHLQVLQLESEILIQSASEQNVVSNEKQIVIKNDDFNPYIGIGGGNVAYGVNDIYASVPSLKDDKPDGPGLASLINVIGLDKMINMDELGRQMKNMTPEDIKKTTSSIQDLLQATPDNKAAMLISEMMSSIEEELLNDGIKDGDPMKKMHKIAQNISQKMGPKVGKNGISFQDLLSSTEAISKNYKDQHGQSMFDEKMDPFKMMRQFMESGSEQQCINQCNSMLQQMGLGHMDVSKMMPQFQQSQHNGRRQPPSQGRTKRK